MVSNDAWETSGSDPGGNDLWASDAYEPDIPAKWSMAQAAEILAEKT